MAAVVDAEAGQRETARIASYRRFAVNNLDIEATALGEPIRPPETCRARTITMTGVFFTFVLRMPAPLRAPRSPSK